MNDFFDKLVDEYIPNILAGIIVLIIALWLAKMLSKIIGRALKRSKTEHAVVTFIMSFVKVALNFIAIITALATMGVDVTSIVTALGAAAVTVGLALQSSMSNIASGVLIIINKPFKAGDLLEFENLTGTVTKIELFNTYLTTLDNKTVVIPNSRLTSNNVVNCTGLVDRRLDLKYTISYEDDIAKVKGLLYSLIADYELILKDPQPLVCVGEHLSSGVEIIVKAWVNKDDYWDVYHYMQENVKLLFDENNITIPFEQVVVHSFNNNDK